MDGLYLYGIVEIGSSVKIKIYNLSTIIAELIGAIGLILTLILFYSLVNYNFFAEAFTLHSRPCMLLRIQSHKQQGPMQSPAGFHVRLEAKRTSM